MTKQLAKAKAIDQRDSAFAARLALGVAATQGIFVEILQEGVGHRALAAELGIPQATARQWARAYAVGGADAVLNAGSHHHTYSFDVKLAVVKDRLEHGLTVREAMVKHKIPSESSVKAWCRQYRDGGEAALVDKPRGRKPRVKKAE